MEEADILDILLLLLLCPPVAGGGSFQDFEKPVSVEARNYVVCYIYTVIYVLYFVKVKGWVWVERCEYMEV